MTFLLLYLAIVEYIELKNEVMIHGGCLTYCNSRKIILITAISWPFEDGRGFIFV
jgi:hypothetical protein